MDNAGPAPPDWWGASRGFFLPQRAGQAWRLKGPVMLAWAMIFLLVALISGAVGFAGAASPAEGTARLMFFVFLVLFALALVTGAGREI